MLGSGPSGLTGTSSTPCGCWVIQIPLCCTPHRLWGHLAISGDVFSCHNSGYYKTREAGDYPTMWLSTHTHPTMHRTAVQQRMWSEVKVAQSCLTLCNPMDCSLPGSSVHGILQARILEWVAVPFFSGSSQPEGWIQVSRFAGEFFTVWATRETPNQEYSVLSVKCEPAWESFPRTPSLSLSLTHAQTESCQTHRHTHAYVPTLTYALLDISLVSVNFQWVIRSL